MPTRRHLAAGGLVSAVLLLDVSAGCGTVPDASGSTGDQSQAPSGSQPTSAGSPSPSATPTTPPRRAVTSRRLPPGRRARRRAAAPTAPRRTAAINGVECYDFMRRHGTDWLNRAPKREA